MYTLEMRNKFKGNYFKCNKIVESGTGFFQRTTDLNPTKRPQGKWVLRCKECVGKGN